jgi:glycosyltransferase involved in cell wall biosynthesis
MPRVAFVNCGFLGHRVVADLMRELVRLLPIDATHINLSEHLTAKDRALRWLLSVRAAPTAGPFGNLDLRRWRQELNIGWMTKRRLAAAERSTRFDVLHFTTQSCGYGNVRRMRQTPTIVSIDATSRLASREAASALGRCTYAPNIAADRSVFRAARAIVATSTWAARDVVDIDPGCVGKIHVLPIPIRDVFEAGLAEERYARSQQTAARPVRALFVGGDFRRKGGDDLLAAWRAAGFDGHAELHVVTDWKIDAASLPAGVRVTPAVTPYSDAWQAMWRDADLFVMPSLHEAFGLVYEEAAAAGLPAIGAAINAVPEIIVDGTTGMLVPPGDVRALTEALRVLVGSAARRHGLGSAARARIGARASLSAYAARLGAIIEGVVSA